MSLEIRTYEAKDIDLLADIRVKQQSELYGDIEHDRIASFKAEYAEFLNRQLYNDNFICLVITENAKIVSTLTVVITDNPPQSTENGRYGYVCAAYTYPNYRRRGFMRDLLNEANDYVKQLNVGYLYFDSFSDRFIELAKNNHYMRRTDYYSRKVN